MCRKWLVLTTCAMAAGGIAAGPATQPETVGAKADLIGALARYSKTFPGQAYRIDRTMVRPDKRLWERHANFADDAVQNALAALQITDGRYNVTLVVLLDTPAKSENEMPERPRAKATATETEERGTGDAMGDVGVEQTSTGKTIFVGPRGGRYHYSKSGKKVYEKKR